MNDIVLKICHHGVTIHNFMNYKWLLNFGTLIFLYTQELRTKLDEKMYELYYCFKRMIFVKIAFKIYELLTAVICGLQLNV